MLLFLSSWSLCHSFRSFRTNGDSFCFCPTVGFWFALMTFRTRPMWGSSFCALTISTTFTWLQPACDGMSTWWSSPSSSVRAINQIESPLDNVWIPQIEACKLSGTILSTTIHVVLEVSRYPGKTVSISVQLAWSLPYFKVEVRELSNPLNHVAFSLADVNT